MAAARQRLHVSFVSLQNDCKWGLGASDVRADVLTSDFAKNADDPNPEMSCYWASPHFAAHEDATEVLGMDLLRSKAMSEAGFSLSGGDAALGRLFDVDR